MFPGYVALYLVAQKVSKFISDSSYWSSHKLESSLKKYRKLQMYTKFVNVCFQAHLALQIKVTLIICSVLLGAVLLNARLCATTSTECLFLAVYVVIVLYVFMIVGYLYPGLVNSCSKNMLKSWENDLFRELNLTVLRSSFVKLHKRYIKSCQDVRIYFGYDNYYENCTSINTARFVLESTLNLVSLL